MAGPPTSKAAAALETELAKILVVDDEVTLVETIRYNLKREGFEVVIGHDGAEALAVARRERPT